MFIEPNEITKRGTKRKVSFIGKKCIPAMLQALHDMAQERKPLVIRFKFPSGNIGYDCYTVNSKSIRGNQKKASLLFPQITVIRF